MKNKTFADLIGQQIVKIEGMKKGSDKVILFLASGESVTLLHHQDCCEVVQLEDVIGTPEDLLKGTIGVAQEVCGANKNSVESETWTFYHLATVTGWVTLRWVGSSNGYYSEEVDTIWQ